MVRHEKRVPASDRRDVLADWDRWTHEGLNSLPDLNYKIISKDSHTLYTRILIDIGPSPRPTTASIGSKKVE